MRVLRYNRAMRWLPCAACLILMAALVWADQKTPLLLPCAPASQAACNPTKQDLKEARAAFDRGLKLQEKDPDLAYEQFVHAAELVPRNINYITAREATRQQLISKHIVRGNAELESGKQVEALADFE